MKQYLYFLKENIYKVSLRNIIHYFIAALQLFCIICGIVSLCQKKDNLIEYEIPLSSLDLQSGSALMDGSLYIDENTGSGHFIHGPYLELKKGTYRITVNYKATETAGILFLYDEDALYDEIQSDEYYLKSNTNIFSTEFAVKEDLERFECRVIYLGEGSLKITSIVLQETASGTLKTLFNIIVMVLVVQALYYLYYCYRVGILQKKRFEILGLVFIWILSSYPFFTDYILQGSKQDLLFHLKRIEGIKEGLLSGQFPVKIQPGWWSGAGYATGVYYPDAFLYFPACLRILGFNVQEAFRIFVLCINGLTCIISYVCFNKIVNNVKISLLGTLIYATSIYRLTVLDIRQAVGEFVAMTFLPLVLYGFLLIIEADTSKGKRFLWLPLVLGMTGVLNSHMITSELSVLFMAILSVLFIKDILQKKRWLILVKAAVITFMLNLWELVPFLDYFMKRTHMISMESSGIDIQKSGTFLGQIFMSIPIFFMDAENEYTSEGIGVELPTSIGISIFLLSGMAIWLMLDRNKKKERDTILSTRLVMVGFIAVIFSLHVFPWNKIGTINEAVNKIVFIVQFLWRYLGYANLFLCVGGLIAFTTFCKETSKEKAYFVSAVISIITIVMALHYNDTIIAGMEPPYRVYTGESVEYTEDKLYLPCGSNSDIYMSTSQPFASENVIIGDFDRNGMCMNLKVISQSDLEEVITIPFVYYEGYQAISQGTDERLKIVETEDKMVGVIVPEHYIGTIKVAFVEKWYWRLAELVSLVMWIALIYSIYQNRRKNKSKHMVYETK